MGLRATLSCRAPQGSLGRAQRGSGAYEATAALAGARAAPRHCRRHPRESPSVGGAARRAPGGSCSWRHFRQLAGRFSGPGVGVHICTPPRVCAFDRRRAGLRLTRLPGLTARTTCRRLGVLAGETHHRENRFRLIPAEDADSVGIPSSLVVWSEYVCAVPAGTQEGQTWGKQ